jgi:hypothetical protein
MIFGSNKESYHFFVIRNTSKFLTEGNKVTMEYLQHQKRKPTTHISSNSHQEVVILE